ncbi:hypothetical protein PAPYR_10413 [Paratrimastix pyriformis]|uniref:Uncharacterized protein n=1 Tax=Paratrimastix pyriformis TaxID=342808 RepID=A0ABQ8U9U6_9EUKA|nr:hypothetical protein PAPYR_10413 [Paratrimastix pyriformis]
MKEEAVTSDDLCGSLTLSRPFCLVNRTRNQEGRIGVVFATSNDTPSSARKAHTPPHTKAVNLGRLA